MPRDRPRPKIRSRTRNQRGLVVADPVDHPAFPLPSAQLLLYRFGPDAEFEGRLVGALERIESGGALEDAVARTGGALAANEFVDATALTELSAEDARAADG
jgi:hypothetical protein